MKTNLLKFISVSMLASILFSCSNQDNTTPMGQAGGTTATVKDTITAATETVIQALKPVVVSQSTDNMVIDVAGQRINLEIVDGQLMASCVSKNKANGARVAPRAFSGTTNAGAPGTWSAIVLNADKKGLIALSKEIKKNDDDNMFETLFGEEVGEIFGSRDIDDEFTFKPKINTKKLPKGFFAIDGKISSKRKAASSNSEKKLEERDSKISSITADAALAGFYIDEFKYNYVGRAKNDQSWFLGVSEMQDEDDKDSKDYIIGNGVRYQGGFKKNSIAFTMMVGFGKSKDSDTRPSNMSGIVLGVAMKATGNIKNPTSVDLVIFAGVFNRLKL